MKTTKDKSKTKIFVALSGGVDSAVSASLLKEEGYDVTGVYMKNWSGDDFGIQADCPWEEDQTDAEAVCGKLNIPFRSFNFEKEYREKVVEYFFSEYEKGRTPNPDVMCNKEIKFKLFLDKALAEGADLIATGHYARREKINDTFKMTHRPEGEDGHPRLPAVGASLPVGLPPGRDGRHGIARPQFKLLTGVDQNKNQVYFLYNLTQEQLSKTLFPIGEYTKTEVRELAKKFDLPNKDKPDSQGICFIGEIDVLKFLMSRIPEKPGEIWDIDTEQKLGEHKGIYFYTIGQRKGLGIGGQKGDEDDPKPFFVCKKDVEKNILYVCRGEEHPALYAKEVEIEKLHLISEDSTVPKSHLQAMVRYRQKPQPGQLQIKDKKIIFIFDKPQKAVSSGQSLVIFDGEECLGGGVIV